MLRLNLGSHGNNIEGYVNIDLHDPTADLKADMTALPYEDNSVDEILASHVLEHVLSGEYERHLSSNINSKTVKETLQEWKRVLKPGGLLEIKVPDFNRIVWLYYNCPLWARNPGGNPPFPAAFDWLVSNGQHAAIFDWPTLEKVLQEAGFTDIKNHSTQIVAAIDRQNIEMRVLCRK